MNEFIKVALRADSSNLEKGFAGANAALGGFRKGLNLVHGTTAKVDNALKGVGARAAGMSAAITAAMLASGKGAMDFERSMRNVNSITKDGEEQFRRTGDQIVDMSRKIPIAAKVMADGLYDISSSGFQGAEALNVLENANISAVAGMTDTAVASKGITAVLNAYGLGAEHAADVSDILFKTVDVGVLTFEDLVQQVGDFVPVGQAAGLEFDQLASGIAALTRGGFPAAQAATALTGVMRAFIKPSEAMKETVSNLGYENAAAMLKTRGLQGSLEDLNKAVDGDITAMGQLFQDTEGLRGVLTLTSNGGELLSDALSSIANESERAGAAGDAYSEQSKSLSNQIDLFKNSVMATRIELGQYYLPVAAEVFQRGSSLLNMFGSLPGPVKAGVAAMMALVQVMTAAAGLFLLHRVRQKAYELALKQMPPIIQKNLVGTKSFTGAVMRLGMTATKAAGGLGLIRQASVRTASVVNASRRPFAAASTGLDILSNKVGSYTAKSARMNTVTSMTSAGLSRLSGATAIYGRGVSVAGARTDRFAASLRRAGTAASLLGRGVRATTRALPGMSTVLTGALMIYDAWSSSAAKAKANVEALNSEAQEGLDLTGPEGLAQAWQDAVNTMNEYRENDDSYNDTGTNIKETYELINPFAANSVSEQQAMIEAQRAEVERLNEAYNKTVGTLNAFSYATGMGGKAGEELAKTLGVDLTKGLSDSEEHMVWLYNTGRITREELQGMLVDAGGAAGALVEAGAAAQRGTFELSQMGEQLRGLESPLSEVTGGTIELTEAQKSLKSAMEDIGSPMAAWNEALIGKKDARQEVVDQEIKALEEASEARIEAAEAATDQTDREHEAIIDSIGDGEDHAEATESAEKRRRDARDAGQKALEELRERESELLQAGREELQSTVEAQILTLSDYAAALETQNAQLEAWKQNLVTVSARAGEDVSRYLASMGEEGVDLVALMATGSDEEVNRMKEAIVDNMEATGNESAVKLSAGMTIAQQAAKMGAEATRRAIIDELGLLPSDVDMIMGQFGKSMESGLNRVLEGLGLPPIKLGRTAAEQSANDAARAGALSPREKNIRPPGFIGPIQNEASDGGIYPESAGVMFNEPGASGPGGEAYIPLGPHKRAASTRLWFETGRRLGIMPMANGGIMSSGSYGTPAEITHNTKVEKQSATNFTGPMYLSDAESVLAYAERKKRLARMRGDRSNA